MLTLLGIGQGQNSSLDADAAAFITAAGITNDTQIAAINTLVISMKAANLWTPMKAIYPMVGGSAASHKFNLKDPRDLDAAFRISFSGGWTHDSNGAKGNGTNATGDTFLIINSQYTDEKISFGRYNDSYTSGIIVGCAGGNDTYDWTPFSSGFISAGSGTGVTGITKQLNGFVSINRPNTTQIKYYREGVVDTIAQPFIGKGTTKMNLCSYDGASTFSNARLKFVFLSTLLSDLENDALRSINLTFQTSLGRQN